MDSWANMVDVQYVFNLREMGYNWLICVITTLKVHAIVMVSYAVMSVTWEIMVEMYFRSWSMKNGMGDSQSLVCDVNQFVVQVENEITENGLDGGYLADDEWENDEDCEHDLLDIRNILDISERGVEKRSQECGRERGSEAVDIRHFEQETL